MIIVSLLVSLSITSRRHLNKKNQNLLKQFSLTILKAYHFYGSTCNQIHWSFQQLWSVSSFISKSVVVWYKEIINIWSRYIQYVINRYVLTTHLIIDAFRNLYSESLYFLNHDRSYANLLGLLFKGWQSTCASSSSLLFGVYFYILKYSPMVNLLQINS